MSHFLSEIEADADLIGHEFRKALSGLNVDLLDLSYHIEHGQVLRWQQFKAALAGFIAGWRSVRPSVVKPPKSVKS